MSEEEKEVVRYHMFPTDYRLLFRILAAFISWYFHRSILWGLIHFFFGWLYIIYILLQGRLNYGMLKEIMEFYFN